jgi:copper chaperone CopZ
MQNIAISIGGMSCAHCLNSVSKAVSQVPGVEIKSVRIGRAELRVTDTAATERVKAAIAGAGYNVQAVTEG